MLNKHPLLHDTSLLRSPDTYLPPVHDLEILCACTRSKATFLSVSDREGVIKGEGTGRARAQRLERDGRGVC